MALELNLKATERTKDTRNVAMGEASLAITLTLAPTTILKDKDIN